MLSIGHNLFAAAPPMLDKTSMDTDELNDLLAKNIRAVMKENGLNMSAWAKDAGLSHTGVRDIINKKVKNPTYKTLLSLADAAGVDVRRITVGPDYLSLEEDAAALLHELMRLDPVEREILLMTSRARNAARGASDGEAASNGE